MSVLVVDDHAGFRRQTRLLLEEAGYDVVGEAADAAAAVASARRLRPDIVLLDVQLPDDDGFSVAWTLALDEAPPAVVLVSGRDRADYAERITICPVRGFIAKIELTAEALRDILADEELR